MPNPADIMKLMGMKNKFEATHPRFVAFLKDVFTGGIPEGSIIEISLTRPDGTKTTSNIKVQPSDVEMFNDLKNLKP